MFLKAIYSFNEASKHKILNNKLLRDYNTGQSYNFDKYCNMTWRIKFCGYDSED